MRETNIAGTTEISFSETDAAGSARVAKSDLNSTDAYFATKN